MTEADQTGATPASLQVYRYRAGADHVEAVIGTLEDGLPQEDLVAHATEALARETFMCYAVSQPDDFVADELCFVPAGRHLRHPQHPHQRLGAPPRRPPPQPRRDPQQPRRRRRLRQAPHPRRGPGRARDGAGPVGRRLRDRRHGRPAARPRDRRRGAAAGGPRRHPPPADHPLHLRGRDQHAAARRRSRRHARPPPRRPPALRRRRRGTGPQLPQLDRAAGQGRPGVHGLRLQDHPRLPGRRQPAYRSGRHYATIGPH